MARARGQRLSRDAVAAIGGISARGAEDVLAAAPFVEDRATQRAIDATLDQLADALRMLAGQADYVAAAWPTPAHPAPSGPAVTPSRFDVPRRR